MSPILVRPVREQLEHDRVIRLLQAKYKRKFEVGINPGNEHAMSVGTEPYLWYPDLVLLSTERARKLSGTVEVETTESVNHLEAMSQWATFSRLKVPFHLYIPAGSVDSARRLCTDLQVSAAEIWAYHVVGDQIRFTLVHRIPQPGDGKASRTSEAEPSRPPVRAANAPPDGKPAAAVKPAAPKPATSAKAATPARPAAAGRAAVPVKAGGAKAKGPAAKPAAKTAAKAAAKPPVKPAPRNGAATASRKSAPSKAAPARRATAKVPARKAAAASRVQKRR